MAEPLTNVEKAAAMLVCLGVDKAAQVLSHLSHEEVQRLANQMAHLGPISHDSRDEILEDLAQRYRKARRSVDSGGMEFVRRLLAETFGEERAALVIEQLTVANASRPFSSLRKVDTRRILDVISSEHPSVIALVMYYLQRDKAAQVMAGLPEDIRHEVVMRLVALQSPMPQMVARLESLLSQKISETRGDDDEGDCDVGTVSGARSLVEILGRADPNVEQGVYEFLQQHDPELAEEVRKSMFVFDDIARLDQRALQLLLRELSSQEIALAMKSAADQFRSLVYANVSENSAKTIKEELDLLGPVRVSVVEEAQQKMIAAARRLADSGIISLRPTDEEAMVA
ncbi:MAG: flagellar motor switch protein FliG [Armatimonadota bacterium]